MIEPATETSQRALIVRNMSVEMAFHARTQHLVAADEWSPPDQHGAAFVAPCPGGPVWSWFLSPQPHPVLVSGVAGVAGDAG